MELRRQVANKILQLGQLFIDKPLNYLEFERAINSLVNEDEEMTMQEVKDTYFPNHTIEELREIGNSWLGLDQNE